MVMKYNGNAKMQEVVTQVTNLAWKMVTLSPPVSFGAPETLSEDLYELTDMDNHLENDTCYTFECRRPVLFFGPLGTVGQKGSAYILPKNVDHTNQPDPPAVDPIHKDVELSEFAY